MPADRVPRAELRVRRKKLRGAVNLMLAIGHTGRSAYALSRTERGRCDWGLLGACDQCARLGRGEGSAQDDAIRACLAEQGLSALQEH